MTMISLHNRVSFVSKECAHRTMVVVKGRRGILLQPFMLACHSRAGQGSVNAVNDNPNRCVHLNDRGDEL